MLGDLVYLLCVICYFAIPILWVVLFVVSLYRYFSAKKQNKMHPGTFSDKEIKIRKIIPIVLAVIAIVFVAAVIGLIALAYAAVAYM